MGKKTEGTETIDVVIPAENPAGGTALADARAKFKAASEDLRAKHLNGELEFEEFTKQLQKERNALKRVIAKNTPKQEADAGSQG